MMMKKKINRETPAKKQNNQSLSELTVYDHLLELRSRILFYLICLALASGISYYFHPSIIKFLISPLPQQLYYTNPAGNLQFGVQVAVFIGFVVTVPVLVYQVLRFIEPVLPTSLVKQVDYLVLFSMLLVFTGVCVAYFLIIPATLTFLLSFNLGTGIESLITVDHYFSFITFYLGGFAVLFQLPLILYLINRFTRATWKTFLKYQRYVIVLALVASAILTPTPDLFNLALFAMPVIVLFYCSILVMALTGKRK